MTFVMPAPQPAQPLDSTAANGRLQYQQGMPDQEGADVHVFETRVPEAKREQQRIADCLSSLDTQITAETQQLASLKAHKQGLMQQLFPAPEAAA